MVPPRSDRIARVPPYSSINACITCTGLSPSKARLSFRFQFLHSWHWPNPRSLATTSGVSVDVLSSRYLDVSVLRVSLKPPILFRSLTLPFDNGNPRHTPFPAGGSEFRYRKWVSPFGNPRIKASSQLLAAYRSVVRPSSPLSAKASTKCPYDT